MNIMLERIFFYMIAIALFVIMFIKLMRKNDTIYLSSLIIQSIGILISLIALIFKLNLNFIFYILTYVMAVILPIFILILFSVIDFGVIFNKKSNYSFSNTSYWFYSNLFITILIFCWCYII